MQWRTCNGNITQLYYICSCGLMLSLKWVHPWVFFLEKNKGLATYSSKVKHVQRMSHEPVSQDWTINHFHAKEDRKALAKIKMVHCGRFGESVFVNRKTVSARTNLNQLQQSHSMQGECYFHAPIVDLLLLLPIIIIIIIIIIIMVHCKRTRVRRIKLSLLHQKMGRESPRWFYFWEMIAENLCRRIHGWYIYLHSSQSTKCR